MGLITVADLDARQVEYVDDAQAQAAIDDASAVVREYVSPVLDDVEAPDTPPLVVTVLVGMLRRLLTNPLGHQSETLGDFTFAAGTNAVATLLPTAREKQLLRKAAAKYARDNGLDVPAWGSSSLHFTSPIPAPPVLQILDLPEQG